MRFEELNFEEAPKIITELLGKRTGRQRNRKSCGGYRGGGA